MHQKQKKLTEKLSEKKFSHYEYSWLEKQEQEGRAHNTIHDYKLRIEKNLIPSLDKLEVRAITTVDLLEVLQVVSERGARETAIRLASVLRRIFNELIVLRIIKNNPAHGLNEILVKPNPAKKKNFSHITNPIVFGRLLRAIDEGSDKRDVATVLMLKLLPLVFLRPVNVRELKWDYINWETKLITIPASKMKTRKEHYVPMSKQVIEILEVLLPLNGDKDFVFVTEQSTNGKPISESTATVILRNKLIDPVTDKPFGVTSHGFRHSASTLMNELGYDADLIELQLAHTGGNKIRATYNKAEMLQQRARLMQAWADYLDSLKADNVVKLRRAS
jgi:integrase